MDAAQVLASAPPDLSAIITSLGVLSLAVAAVVAGVYKGIKDIRKGGADTGHAVAAATIMETSSLTRFTESNGRVTEVLTELITLLHDTNRRISALSTEVAEVAHRKRALTEEEHRLRVAIVDIHEFLRSQRR